MKLIIQNLCLAVTLGLLVSTCSVQQSAVSGSKRAYGYSWEQEKQIGKDADQQVQQQYGLYDNNGL
ncbi:MAG TPA: hypothetical protein VJ964_02000, partial [Balneolaceae bacterium]|nr:hypothetical protein [Balneolaceae bacterium]